MASLCTENPWLAAQRFLEKHELPSTYADQVVDFIQKNSGGVQLGSESSTYVDPYTGGSRYQGSSTASQTTQGGADPFTGSSAYASTPSQPVASSSKRILPHKTYLGFKQMNVAAARSKITALNADSKVLTEQDELNMNEIYALLSQPSIALPKADATDGNERYQPSAFLDLLLRWPESQRFPRKSHAQNNIPVSDVQSSMWHGTWRASPLLSVLLLLHPLLSSRRARGQHHGRAARPERPTAFWHFALCVISS